MSGAPRNGSAHRRGRCSAYLWEGIRQLGATDLLLTTDDRQLDQARGRFDLILDPISAQHDLPLCQAQVRHMVRKFPMWYEQGETWCSRL
jgi:hypothetical protein